MNLLNKLHLDIWSIVIPYLNINDYEDILNFEEFIHEKEKLLKEWKKHTKYTIDKDTSFTHYFRNGIIHRDDDDPAIFGQGFYSWFKNGKLHRDNDSFGNEQHAVENYSGYKAWYRYGYKYKDTDLLDHIQKYHLTKNRNY